MARLRIEQDTGGPSLVLKTIKPRRCSGTSGSTASTRCALSGGGRHSYSAIRTGTNCSFGFRTANGRTCQRTYRPSIPEAVADRAQLSGDSDVRESQSCFQSVLARLFGAPTLRLPTFEMLVRL